MFTQLLGFEKRIELVSTLSKSVPIVANPQITTCIPSEVIQRIDVSISLDASDVQSITGCDRDTYSTADTRRKCSKLQENAVILVAMIKI